MYIYIDLYLLIIGVNDLFFEPGYGVVFVEFSTYFVVGCYGLESHFFVEVEGWFVWECDSCVGAVDVLFCE